METDRTLQANIKKYKHDMRRFSLFLGGLNVKHESIGQYDPLVTGRARIFFLQMPRFMEALMKEETRNFKHLLEYGNVSIDGIQNTTLDFSQMGGGYAGRQFDVATIAKDETSSITIKVYEFSGSPVREYVDNWITGISDPHTGIGHYHGMVNDGAIPYAAKNHTAEAIYVHTGPTGMASDIEYACLFTNMIPKTVKKDHFNYESGSHEIVQTDIEFTTVKYESPQINSVAVALMQKYEILRDYLDFKSDYDSNFVTNNMEASMIEDWAK